MQEKRKREIRIKADSFREKCRISRYGIIDLFRECDRCGYKLLRYPIGENGDLGFSTKKDEDVIIFTNSSSRLSREIFTLAHEIGHVVLHLHEDSSFIDDNVTIGAGNPDEKEQEANYFAACLLMPSDDVSRFLDLEISDYESGVLSAMDIARIMSEFSVSFNMALNRLESLGVIDCNQKLKLDNEKTEKKVGNLLRSASGNIRLNKASDEIRIPYEYIDYVIYNYNHNAIPRETLERVLEYCKLSIEDISDRIVIK
jgi:Zn-dependent peptidase ImmA (M78 family)